MRVVVQVQQVMAMGLIFQSWRRKKSLDEFFNFVIDVLKIQPLNKASLILIKSQSLASLDWSYTNCKL